MTHSEHQVIDSQQVIAAEIIQPTEDLHADLDFYTRQLGFRLMTIHPSDDPAVAVLAGYGLRLRLDRGHKLAAAPIVITRNNGKNEEMVAPNGAVVHLVGHADTVEIPEVQHSFQVRRLADREDWVVGRAGMLYRDLIADRLGGSIIASHIRIPNGGPVPDMVHYHTIGFQLIFCLGGWVKLVYEDQGEPFVLNAGDCVTQPPAIRHRVLEASDNLEVLEIGVPAQHMTTIDHDMELPTGQVNRQREFGGQVFCHFQNSQANWESAENSGFEYCDTGVLTATRGMADVAVFQRGALPVATTRSRHQSNIHFTYVTAGTFTIAVDGQPQHTLTAGDAMVLPPDTELQILSASDDAAFIEISLV